MKLLTSLRPRNPLPAQRPDRPQPPRPQEDHPTQGRDSEPPLGRGILLGASLLGAVGLAAPAQAAQVQVQSQPQPGTLFLSDFFEKPNPEVMPHGEIVERSAKKIGFQGPVVRQEVRENPLTKKAHRFDVYLDQRQFTPEEMRQFLTDYTIQCQVGQMQTATQDLKMWLDQGAHHSAINLSRGCGQSQVVEAVYQRLSPAFNAADPVAQVKATQRLKKVAPGLEVSVEDLTSRDPNVSQPARLQLQQRLVDRVHQASQGSPLLAEAQAKYQTTVEQLAQNKVSVVVAAANSGKILQEMAQDAGGRTVQVSPLFWNNRLASPGVVTVGATAQGSWGEKVADYTNYDGGIDFYANGDAKVDPQDPEKLVNFGTSFAAPQLAAVLTRVHQQNPDWSNAEVELFVRQQMTSAQLDLAGHVPAPTLKTDSAQQYLMR